jgi:hypothetical protein
MRKLVFILIAFIAVMTFIRAYDNLSGMNSAGVFTDKLHANEAVPITVE